MEHYEGLFGFRSDREYSGTLFRLPFRSNPSELSSTCYSHSMITDLLQSINDSGNKLLLFLQNVRRITVRRIDHGMSTPKVLFDLRKPEQIPLHGVSITVMVSENCESKQKSMSNWLVSSHRLAYEKKPAVANLACLLSSSDNTFTVDRSLAGEVFCFLPLSQRTGLPVHVSCNFAVINNRRGIWTSSDKDGSASDPEVQWNVFLMEKVIPVAYTRLLQNLKEMHKVSALRNYHFFSLWPLASTIQQKNPWEKCVDSFYSLLPPQALFYSESTSHWLPLQDSKVLDPGILSLPSTHPSVLDVIFELNIPLVNLPSEYRSHLNLTTERLTEGDFVELFFTTQLTHLTSRNTVILLMLEAYASQFDIKTGLFTLLSRKFSECACIPSAPDGMVLRKCSEIVYQEAPFAGLFDESDNRFPLGMLAERNLAMNGLRHAGMMHASLSCDLVIQRALSVEDLMRKDELKALKRVQLILSTISKGHVCGSLQESKTAIESINFLPVIQKPKDYPLPWYGDGYRLLSGNQLVLSGSLYHSESGRLERIAGSQVPFLCERIPNNGGCGYVSEFKTQKLLCLKSSPSLKEVISHLEVIIHQFESSSPPEAEWITSACGDIYQFIDDILDKPANENVANLEELKALPFIWNGEKFLIISSVALNWKLKSGPYLYTAPPELSSKKHLSKALGIKEEFTCQDAVNALKMMKTDFGNESVNESCISLIHQLISVFQSSSAEDLKALKESQNIYLPDSRDVLQESSSLVYNDAPWAPLEDSSKQVSSKFTQDLATGLGVRLVRSKLLQHYISSKKKHFRGVPFGQHEELTRRIKNILRDYPYDITVLKELLQNTDDAKATKCLSFSTGVLTAKKVSFLKNGRICKAQPC